MEEYMIDTVIKKYKQEKVCFSKQEIEIKEAVLCFRENWNLESEDFVSMLKSSLSKTGKLLDSIDFYPKATLLFLAQKESSRVKEMFIHLFDETKELTKRMIDFRKDVQKLYQIYAKEKVDNHYQCLSAISTYLFLKYPEKYYLFKETKFQSFSKLIGEKYLPKAGDLENLTQYFFLADRVKQEILADKAFHTTDEIELHLLTENILNYGYSLYLQQNNKQEKSLYFQNTILYGPPGTGKTYHTAYYAVGIIEQQSLESLKKESEEVILKRYQKYKENGQIAFVTFHQSYSYEEFMEGIRPVFSEGEDKEKPLQYKVSSGIFKSFCKAVENREENKQTKFSLNDNPTVWKVSLGRKGKNPIRTECLREGHIRLGYDEYGETINKETIFSQGGKNILTAFIEKMQLGDFVLSYYSENTIDAIGVVTGEYEWHNEYNFSKRLRKVQWIEKNFEYDIVQLNENATMTSTAVYKLSVVPGAVMEILREIREEQRILSSSSKMNYVFIIDEINRANLSKILGELITLLEPQKRLGEKEELRLTLPYSKEEFGVPSNVYVLGTMNTADHSLALFDTALRRRFQFIQMKPDLGLLNSVKVKEKNEVLEIAPMLKRMNERIAVLYDEEHLIGQAYFLALREQPTIEVLAEIFERAILPLLEEYFYTDWEKIRLVLADNQKREKENQFIQIKTIDVTLFGNAEEISNEKQYVVNPKALRNLKAYQLI